MNMENINQEIMEEVVVEKDVVEVVEEVIEVVKRRTFSDLTTDESLSLIPAMENIVNRGGVKEALNSTDNRGNKLLSSFLKNKEDLYLILSTIHQMSIDEIKNIPLSETLELLIDLFGDKTFFELFGCVID